MIRTIALFIFVVGMFAILTVSVTIWASTPLVQFSWSTQKCVKVLIGAGSCDNLPTKYEKEWVK